MFILFIFRLEFSAFLLFEIVDVVAFLFSFVVLLLVLRRFIFKKDSDDFLSFSLSLSLSFFEYDIYKGFNFLFAAFFKYRLEFSFINSFVLGSLLDTGEESKRFLE
jgi:hypothetical protein